MGFFSLRSPNTTRQIQYTVYCYNLSKDYKGLRFLHFIKFGTNFLNGVRMIKKISHYVVKNVKCKLLRWNDRTF